MSRWRGRTCARPGHRGAPSGLTIRAFELERDVPLYVDAEATDAVGSVIGVEITDTALGTKLVYAPGVGRVTDGVRAAVEGADALLMDGTFWTDDEPRRFGISDRTAREMGHLPVGGADGTLAWLARLPIKHRVYVHINNTNPMLNQAGGTRAPPRRGGRRQGRCRRRRARPLKTRAEFTEELRAIGRDRYHDKHPFYRPPMVIFDSWRWRAQGEGVHLRRASGAARHRGP